MKSIRARAPRSRSPFVRRAMQANRSFDTKCETLLCSALRGLGLHFGRHVNVDPSLKCKADFVFLRKRLCVFVDGCFWHGCLKHFHAPKINRAWWNEKINDNRRRDRRKAFALRRKGWTVIRVWEHEIKTRGADKVAQRIASTLGRGNGRKTPSTWQLRKGRAPVS